MMKTIVTFYSLLFLSCLINYGNSEYFISLFAGSQYISYDPKLSGRLNATETSFSNIYGLWSDSFGNLYITEPDAHRISKISPDGVVTFFAGQPDYIGGGWSSDSLPANFSLLNSPCHIWGDSNGDLFVAERNRIRKISASTGILSTIAGRSGDFPGDSAPATSVSLNYPVGIHGDSAGNIFFADRSDNLIRVVFAVNNSLQTVIGDGTKGYNGEGTTALSTKLDNPSAVFVDTILNIYFCDRNNHRVRFLNSSTGLVTTITGDGGWGSNGNGGPASSARIVNPMCVWKDTIGNLYICESQVVRMISAMTNIITAFSGSGTVMDFAGDGGLAVNAKMATPTAVFQDSFGNIFICDSTNNRVRKVTVTTNIITTVVGNGLNGDNGTATNGIIYSPYGITVDTLSNVYIVETGFCRIRKVNTGNDSIITTIAGTGGCSSSANSVPATSSMLNNPRFIALDTAGNVYFSEIWSGRIRKVDMTTNIMTVTAGGSGSDFSSENSTATAVKLGNPQGIWIDSQSNLYFVDSKFQKVIKLTASTQLLTTVAGTGVAGFSDGPASTAKFNNPHGIMGDSNNNLYIADRNNARIRLIHLPSNTVSTIAGTGDSGNSGDGGPSLLATLSNPTSIFLTPDNNMFVGDALKRIRYISDVGSNSSTIYSVAGTLSSSQIVLTASIAPANSDLGNVLGIWADTIGRLYFTENGFNRVRVLFSVATPTSQPSTTPSAQPSAFPTQTPTSQPSRQPLSAPTGQPTSIPSVEPSSQPSNVPSSDPTSRPSSLPSGQPVVNPTSFPSSQPSVQPSSIPSSLPSSKPSLIPSAEPTSQPSCVPSSSPTTIPSGTPSIVPTGQPTSSPTQNPSSHPSTFPSSAPTGFPSANPTIQPTVSPSNSPSALPSACPSTDPSYSPTSYPTFQPTSIPTTLPSAAPSLSPTGHPTVVPTTIPSILPSIRPTGSPSCEPSAGPSGLPSSSPTRHPSTWPTISPTNQPSSRPTVHPSGVPSCIPSSLPSGYPSSNPSLYPTGIPSSQPSNSPSSFPTIVPSSCPTTNPSCRPSSSPSYSPTVTPSLAPSCAPSSQPSSSPSSLPTVFPTSNPSAIPTDQPSTSPSSLPTGFPTIFPSVSPSATPSIFPTSVPTSPPSTHPSTNPSVNPTTKPTSIPTLSPSLSPTAPSHWFNMGTIPWESITVLKNFTSLFEAQNFKFHLFLFGSFSRTTPIMQNISLPSSHSTKRYFGQNYVIFGSKIGFTLNLEISSLSLQQQAVRLLADFEGIEMAAYSQSVACIGDMNQDHNLDLAIGSPLADQISILFGKEKASFQSLTEGFTIYAASSGEYLGWSVSAAGDMNKDGYDDVVFSALLSSRCYLLYGKATNYSNIYLSHGLMPEQGLEMIGTTGFATGISLSAVGDFNQDYFDDLLLSETGSSGANRLYVVYGNASLPSSLKLNDLDGQRGVVITTPVSSFAGLSVSGVGDVNGDGFQDIAIGSLPYKGGYVVQNTYIVYGRSTNESNHRLHLSNLRPSDGYEISGGGFMVGRAGDIDGDGYDDMIVNQYDDWMRQSRGGVYFLPVPGKHSLTKYPTISPSRPPTSTPTFFPTALTDTHSPTAGTVTPTFRVSYPTSVPSSQPTNRISRRPSTIRPTSSRPSISATPHPTVPPTIAPSISPTPTPTTTSNPTLRPTVPITARPSRSPSVTPSINIDPTSTPSFSPTLSASHPVISYDISDDLLPNTYTDLVVGKANSSLTVSVNDSFAFPAFRRFLLETTTKYLAITGGKGRNIYVIFDRPNTTITITNFQSRVDILDLSNLPTMTSLSTLSFTTIPLTLVVGQKKQRIILSDYNEGMSLSPDNFKFSSPSSSSRSSSASSTSMATTSRLPVAEILSPTVLGLIIFFVVLIGLTFCLCQYKPVRNNTLEQHRKKIRERQQVLYHYTQSQSRRNQDRPQALQVLPNSQQITSSFGGDNGVECTSEKKKNSLERSIVNSSNDQSIINSINNSCDTSEDFHHPSQQPLELDPNDSEASEEKMEEDESDMDSNNSLHSFESLVNPNSFTSVSFPTLMRRRYSEIQRQKQQKRNVLQQTNQKYQLSQRQPPARQPQPYIIRNHSLNDCYADLSVPNGSVEESEPIDNQSHIWSASTSWTSLPRQSNLSSTSSEGDQTTARTSLRSSRKTSSVEMEKELEDISPV